VFLVYLFILIILAEFFFISSASAYIDPNAGGFYFRTVAPLIYIILAVIVLIGVFWKRLFGMLSSLLGRKKGSNSASRNE
jgi:uncharacterized membrane protein